MCGKVECERVVGICTQSLLYLRISPIPSKLLLFPDEGHWVLKPQNSLLWYHTVLDWLGIESPEAM